MNANPKTTRTKPAIFSSRNWFGEEAAADERRADAEQDEDRGEAEDERHARDDDAPRRSRLPEVLRVDRRHRREVAGHERQHAGREERDESGEERDRDRGRVHLSSRSARAPRPRRRSSSGSSGVAASRPAGDAGSTPRRACRPRPAPPASAASGRIQARSPNPPLGGSPAPAPEVGDERVLDLLLRVAGRDALADEELHALGDRRVRLVERRLADRADELGLEIRGARRIGWPLRRPASAPTQTQSRTRARAASRFERLVDGVAQPCLILVRVDRADDRVDDASLPIDHERLGIPGHAVALRDLAFSVEYERERRDRSAARTGARPSGGPSSRARRTTSAAVAVLAPDLLEVRRLVLARRAPRRPEVDDDGLAAERRERELRPPRRAARARTPAPRACRRAPPWPPGRPPRR